MGAFDSASMGVEEMVTPFSLMTAFECVSKVPMMLASRSHFLNSLSSLFWLPGLTASSIRSCDSDSITS